MSFEKKIGGIVVGVMMTLFIGAVLFVILDSPDYSAWVKGAFSITLVLIDVVCWARAI